MNIFNKIFTSTLARQILDYISLGIFMIIGFVLIAFSLSLFEIMITTSFIIKTESSIIASYLGTGFQLNLLAVACLFCGSLILRGVHLKLK